MTHENGVAARCVPGSGWVVGSIDREVIDGGLARQRPGVELSTPAEWRLSMMATLMTRGPALTGMRNLLVSATFTCWPSMEISTGDGPSPPSPMGRPARLVRMRNS